MCWLHDEYEFEFVFKAALLVILGLNRNSSAFMNCKREIDNLKL